MLLVVIRKMLNNRWLILCLLIGSIIAVAMVSSIPMYTSGVLQRTLTRDLEDFQKEYSAYAGFLHIKADLQYAEVDNAQKVNIFEKLDDRIRNDLLKGYKVPVSTGGRRIDLGYFSVSGGDIDGKLLKFQSATGIEDHIKLLEGHKPSSNAESGAYEVIVADKAMKELGLALDKTYELAQVNNGKSYIIKVVGAFTIKDNKDPYWSGSNGIDAFDGVVLNDGLLYNEFIKGKDAPITSINWNYALDYHKITTRNIASIISAHEAYTRWANANFNGLLTINFNAYDILQKYLVKEKQLRLLLWILQVPILLMLAFYIFMVSQLIINHDRNEIAVLRSRGGSGLQIFNSYLLEGIIISFAALLTGPLLGLMLCKVLGASSGFLEFVSRKALPLSLSLNAYLYALITLVVFIATMLIPAFIASRTSIVEHKRKVSRGKGKQLWKMIYFDIILIGISIYGINKYKNQLADLGKTGVKGTDLSIDPVLFLVSTLFILGAGLLFLRLFPYIVRFIFWMGRKIWSPVFYATFIQIGRSGGQEQFIMLFIILSLSIGIFSANAARTVNTNSEEKIRYQVGADMDLRFYWGGEKEAMAMAAAGLGDQAPTVFTEPPFSDYCNLDGVQAAAKVLQRSVGIKAQVNSSTWVEKPNLMGIVPSEFAKVAWFRRDLLPYKITGYLNYLAKNPTAVLVSKSFKDSYGAKVGDRITIEIDDQIDVECVIYAFIDYWPGFNPHKNAGDAKDPDLIVANLTYLQNNVYTGPYDVWIKEVPDNSLGTVSNRIFRDMEKKKLNQDPGGIVKLVTSDTMLAEAKNSPSLQGTSGALTLGFVVAIAISAIGFLIYWILSIKSRVLQFGIFRAMGLSLKKVIGMIACEQVLISGSAILTGIIIGGITSDLFVPFLQLAYGASEQVPPFKVVSLRIDYYRLYMLVFLMLAIGFSVLGTIISRINMSQAIKLGED